MWRRSKARHGRLWAGFATIMGGLRISRMCTKLPSGINSVGGQVRASTRETFAVYICLCNALTDRQVKQAAATPGFTKPGDIYAACGCRAQCGQCTRALINLLRGDATLLEAQPAG
jgi:bacterioferritin-associated ferredoxin